MSFNWTEYLNLARSLVGQSTASPSEEAKKRCAISRAYYAALLIARTHLASQSPPVIPTYRDNIHKFVPDELQKTHNRNAQKAAAELRRMRKDRGKADYDDAVQNLSTIASISIRRAESVIRLLVQI